MQTLVHYVHGFNSASTHNGLPASDKVEYLSSLCNMRGWTFIPHNIDYTSVDSMTSFFTMNDNSHSKDDHIYVGTSMGGLLVMNLLRRNYAFNDRGILINPFLLRQDAHLESLMNVPLKNYVTGARSMLTTDAANFIKNLQDASLLNLPSVFSSVVVHACLDDDVLDMKKLVSVLKGYHQFTVIAHPQGGHRFNGKLFELGNSVVNTAAHYPPLA